MTAPDPDVIPLLEKAKPLLSRMQDLLHVEKEYLPQESGKPVLLLRLYFTPVGQTAAPVHLTVACDADGAYEYGLLSPEEYDQIPTTSTEDTQA